MILSAVSKPIYPDLVRQALKRWTEGEVPDEKTFSTLRSSMTGTRGSNETGRDPAGADAILAEARKFASGLTAGTNPDAADRP